MPSAPRDAPSSSRGRSAGIQWRSARPDQITRLTWYVTDRDAYLNERKAIGAAYREIIGSHYPAMSVVVVAPLIEPGALVEIEATTNE